MVKILAVASGGGHWEQLLLLKDVLDQFEVHYATTDARLPHRSDISSAAILPDCNRDELLSSLRCLFAAVALVKRLRPEVVISTGAAPGFFCIVAARLLGARTLWLDSIANAEKLSMCGKLARYVSTQCVTQWPHLSGQQGPTYAGSLL